MPIKPIDAPETEGSFEVVHRTLSRRASAAVFSLPRLAKADARSLTVALPHRVAFLGQDDIRRGTIPRKQKANRWRFLVLEDREAIAAATAIRADTDVFEFGGLDEGPFVTGTEEAIHRAEAFLGDGKGEFEAVLLLVPVVYVVALWLQDLAVKIGDDDDHAPETDLFFAIPPSNPALDPSEPMTPAPFLKALRQAR